MIDISVEFLKAIEETMSLWKANSYQGVPTLIIPMSAAARIIQRNNLNINLLGAGPNVTFRSYGRPVHTVNQKLKNPVLDRYITDAEAIRAKGLQLIMYADKCLPCYLIITYETIGTSVFYLSNDGRTSSLATPVILRS